PACDGDELVTTPLSDRGRIWSYADARYRPPPPYVSGEDFEPYAVAAVELAAERIVVLGQVVKGIGVDELAVGMEVELVVEELDPDHLVWKWRPLVSENPGEPDAASGVDAALQERQGEGAIRASATQQLRRGSERQARGRRPPGRHASVGQVGARLRRVRPHGGAGRVDGRRPRLDGHRVRRGRRHDPERLPRVHRRRHIRAGPGLVRGARVELLRGLRLGRAGDE